MAVGSIVDYLKSQGQDSSYSNRKKLAEQYGMGNYSGTAAQNTALLKQLQSQTTQTAAQTTQSPTTTQSQVTTTQTTTPTKYKKSKETQNYLSALKELEANKPDEFSSQYTEQIDAILDGILNRKEFSYGTEDLMNDSLYQMYKDNYMAQGNKAMRDTMGNAAALTGGYGSTYSQAAGQQAYDSYLQNLNDKALEFADRAYSRYQDETADRYNQLSAVKGLDDTDYSRYRDTVSDYYNDLNYLNNRYTYENGFDYDEYLNQIQQQQWQQEFDFQKSEAEREQANWAAEYALAQQKAAKSGSSGGSGSSGSSFGSTAQLSWADAKQMYMNTLQSEGKMAAEALMQYLESEGLVNATSQRKAKINSEGLKNLEEYTDKMQNGNVLNMYEQVIKSNLANDWAEEWRKKWLK